MYDLIGDIHGYAEPLELLLHKLGYTEKEGCYRHPTRQLIFVGDLIDRGPGIARVLDIVMAMHAAGTAYMVLGNHEFNFINYHTPAAHRPGYFLRSRNEKNAKQCEATLQQLSPDQIQHALAWFRTLPFHLELDELRVVHACWDSKSLAVVQASLMEYGGLTPAFLHTAATHAEPLFAAVETVLKGKELHLPNGLTFQDKEGHVRRAARTRWYLDPAELQLRDYIWENNPLETTAPIPTAVLKDAAPYPAEERPVFIGHYWLNDAMPAPLASNVACLDYSVAKGGKLCAYRWQGERQLLAEHFIWVHAGA